MAASSAQTAAATQLLKGIGLTPNADNLRLASGWIQSEGGLVNNTNNPLNTTLKSAGALGSINGDGVTKFDNLNDGIAADASTLKEAPYASIRDALQSGDQNAFIKAVGSSPWGTSGSLLSSVLGSAPSGSAQPTAASPVQLPGGNTTKIPTSPVVATDYANQAIASIPDPSVLAQQQNQALLSTINGGPQTGSQMAQSLLAATQNAQMMSTAAAAARSAAPTSSATPGTTSTQPAAQATARTAGGTPGQAVPGGAAPVKSSDGGDPYAKARAAVHAPLGTFTGIIGRPYEGTHTNFGNWESDNAVDLAAPAKTPVYAVAPGVIGSQIGPLNSNDPHLAGDRLHLVTNGNEFYYQHLLTLAVKAGQHVKAGQLLGYTGALNHLHIASKNGDPVQILGLDQQQGRG